MVAELQSICTAGGWVGGAAATYTGAAATYWVAGQVRLYNHIFGHPIEWAFPLGRVWQKVMRCSPIISDLTVDLGPPT